MFFFFFFFFSVDHFWSVKCKSIFMILIDIYVHFPFMGGEKCVYDDFLRMFCVCSNDWWRSWKRGRREVQSPTRSDL